MSNASSNFQNCQREQGFVLVLTLSVIAITLLASSYIANWINQEIENHSTLITSAQQTIDNYSTLSTIIYISSTHPLTYSGIAFPDKVNDTYSLPFNENGDPLLNMQGNELRLDSRVYQGIGDSQFQLQDEAGLISVNTLTKERLVTLFAMAGINGVYAVPALAKLNDYIDKDSDYRLNGAERKQYLSSNREGPKNQRLRSPQELSAVLDWTSIMSKEQFDKVSYLLTSSPIVSVNINTAPKESLLLLGLSPYEVDQIITFRENQSINFANIRSIIPSTVNLPDTDIFQYYASRYLRVNIQSAKFGKIDEYHIKMTPRSTDGKPWHIRYKKTLFAPQIKQLNEPLPTGKAIFSDQ